MSSSRDLTREEPELVHELDQLVRSVEVARQCTNKVRWQTLVQRRTTSISRLLRRLQRASGAGYRCRVKESGIWRVLALHDGTLTVVAEVPVPGARTFTDLLRPIQVRIIRPDLLDAEALKDVKP